MFFALKDNQKSWGKTAEGENIFTSNNRFVSEIYFKNNGYNSIFKSPQLKHGHRILIDISPKKICNLPMSKRKMLNIIHHQGNESQNHSDISLHNN